MDHELRSLRGLFEQRDQRANLQGETRKVEKDPDDQQRTVGRSARHLQAELQKASEGVGLRSLPKLEAVLLLDRKYSFRGLGSL